MSLGALLDNSVTHERVAVDVDRRLTRGAWVGVGVLVAQLVMLHIGRVVTTGYPTWSITSWAFTGFGHPDAAHRIVVGALALAVIGAVLARGFTWATTRGIYGQTGLMAMGVALAVPVAWVVALTVALVLAIGFAVFVGLVLAVVALVVFVVLAPLLWRLTVAAAPVLFKIGVTFFKIGVAFIMTTVAVVAFLAPIVGAVTVGVFRLVGFLLRPLAR